MKKLFFILMLLSVTCAIKAINHPDNYILLDTFYGAKASNKANNPCKGETTRVCGTRHIKYYKVYTTSRYSLYDKFVEVRDENGVLIHTESGNLEVPVGTSIQQATDKDDYVTIEWEG